MVLFTHEMDSFLCASRVIKLKALAPIPPACDEVYSEERESATTDELANSYGVGRFKVPVEHSASHNDGDGEQHKLSGNNLGGVEALQGLV